MIEQLKQRPKSINKENLSHVNSWWDKILIKNVQKITKQLKHFKNDKLILNSQNFKKKSINYDDYLSFSNKILEFWIQKEKKIVDELKVLQKFSKMLTAFGQEAGILANIQTIDTYFTTINKKDVGKKQQLAIQLGNETILKLYDSYKENIVKVMQDDKEIKEKLNNLFATDIISDDKMFDALSSLKILFKFIMLAYRSKKISKKDFGQIYFNTIILNSYLARFMSLYQRFILQIK